MSSDEEDDAFAEDEIDLDADFAEEEKEVF